MLNMLNLNQKVSQLIAEVARGAGNAFGQRLSNSAVVLLDDWARVPDRNLEGADEDAYLALLGGAPIVGAQASLNALEEVSLFVKSEHLIPAMIALQGFGSDLCDPFIDVK